MVRGRSVSLIALTSGAVLAGGAIAQDNKAFVSVFSFGQSLEWSDNVGLKSPADPGASARTTMDYRLTTETRSAKLTFGLGGDILASKGSSFKFDHPRASLAFSTSNANAALDVSARYTARDVSTYDFVLVAVGDDPVTGETIVVPELVLGDGTRHNTSMAASFATGLSAPFGLKFSLSANDTRYSDTVDPNLADSQKISGSVEGTFRLSSVASVKAGVTRTRSKSDNLLNTRKDSDSVTISGQYSIRPDLQARASASYNWNETRTTGGTVTSNGAGYGFGVTQDLVNGTLGFNLDSKVLTNGRQTSANINRSMGLPKGSLSYSVGVVKPSGERYQPLFSVGYTHDLPAGSIGLTLRQQTTVDDDNKTVLNTSARATYSQTINAVSSWNASLGYASTQVLGATGDRQSLNLGVSYRRAVGQDWDLVVGYTHAQAQSAAAADRQSNTVSVGFQRDFFGR